MKEKRKPNKYIDLIKKIWKSQRGRAILFFLFYIVFFIVIISLLRTNYSSPTINENKNSISANYNITSVTNSNYHFTREEIINNNITTFVGEKANDKTKGLMSNNENLIEYFIYSNINLIKENDSYKVTNQIYNFDEITNDQNIKAILNKSTLISKTEYDLGNTVYNYQISTTTLEKLIKNNDIDIADNPNQIIVETNEENKVTKITYDISSYASYYYGQSTQVKITMSYSSFNEIEELSIPEIK